MSKIGGGNKYTVRDSANADTNAEWSPQTAITAGATIAGVHTIQSPSAMHLGVRLTQDSYFSWNLSTATTGVIDTAKDLQWAASNTTFFRVPWGIANNASNPSFHILKTSDGTATANLVEV